MRDYEAGSYDTPLICSNGHVVTSSLELSPEAASKFCSKCGEETTSTCKHCEQKIRGYHNIPGVIGGPSYIPPSYCHNCGKPYTWTEKRLDAAKEFADTLEELTDAEKDTLKQDLPTLTRDTPEAQVAATRYKKVLSKAGPQAASVMRDIIVDITSEAIKKMLWPTS